MRWSESEPAWSALADPISCSAPASSLKAAPGVQLPWESRCNGFLKTPGLNAWCPVWFFRKPLWGATPPTSGLTLHLNPLTALAPGTVFFLLGGGYCHLPLNSKQMVPSVRLFSACLWLRKRQVMWMACLERSPLFHTAGGWHCQPVSAESSV